MKITPIYTPEAIAFFTVMVPAKGNWGKAIETAQDAADAVDRYLYQPADVVAVDRTTDTWYVQVKTIDYNSVAGLRRRVESQTDRLLTGGYRLSGDATIYTREG